MYSVVLMAALTTTTADATSFGWRGGCHGWGGCHGGWGGGVYSPKWTSATYTLLTLCDIGVPPNCPQVQRGAGYVLGMLLGAHSFGEFSDRLEFMNQIASDDTDAVNRANVTGQQE